MKAIGIDIGATKTIIALIDEKARILRKLKLASPKSRKELIELLNAGIKKIKGNQKVKGIGIGIAAFLDERKKIMLSPNMPFLNNFDLQKKIERKTGMYCLIENDASCFTLAEALNGNAKKYNSVFGITIGSGIGSALIINKSIYKGKSFAVEAGHMQGIVLQGKEKRKCNCSKFNCIEAFASATAMLNEAKKQKLKFRNAKELCQSKNSKARKIIENAAVYFGLFLSNIVYLFDPEIIVLGGGLSNCKAYISKAKRQMKKELKIKRKPLIVKAFFGENATAIGAALLVLLKKQEF